MKEITVTVYEFDELSDKAQEVALHAFRSTDIHPHYADAKKTLNEFSRMIGYEYCTLELRDVEFLIKSQLFLHQTRFNTKMALVSYLNKHFYKELYRPKKYYNKDRTKCRISNILLEYNPYFTGYYLDETIFEPLFEAMNGNTMALTLHDVFNDCLRKFVIACNEEYSYYYSAEGYSELCQCNNWYFNSNGTLYGAIED